MNRQTRTLALCLQTPGALPPLLWGDPGTAKSSMVRAIAASLDWDCEVLCPGERGDGAFGVVPVPSDDRRVLTYPLPDWAERYMDGRKGLVFIDEINTCPPALSPALLGLSLDGRIAGKVLPLSVRRCAAANPPDQAAGGWDLAPALANRFIHLKWEAPTSAEWTDWLLGVTVNGDTAKANIPILDLDEWQRQWSQAQALAAAFHRKNPGALSEDWSKVHGRFPLAVATARTWETATRLLATCRAANELELYPAMAEGCLGHAIGIKEWVVWLRENDLPDPEEVLADPDRWQPDPRKPDQVYATLLAVAEAALAETIGGNKMRKQDRFARWQQGWRCVGKPEVTGRAKDLGLLAARKLGDPKRRPKDGLLTDDVRRVITIYREFIDLAGLLPAGSEKK